MAEFVIIATFSVIITLFLIGSYSLFHVLWFVLHPRWKRIYVYDGFGESFYTYTKVDYKGNILAI